MRCDRCEQECECTHKVTLNGCTEKRICTDCCNEFQEYLEIFVSDFMHYYCSTCKNERIACVCMEEVPEYEHNYFRKILKEMKEKKGGVD